MRPSPHRHTLAVLRTTIGLTQKQMAELAECSTATIQAIELGKLKMSDRIAQLLFLNTGVSLKWLLANNPAAPPTDRDTKNPYTKETFEEHRASLFAPNRGDSRSLAALFDLWTLYARHLQIYSIFVTEAYKQGTEGLFAYKSTMGLLDIAKTSLKHTPAISKEILDRQDPEVSYDRINDAFNAVQTFAQDTYAHFRQVVDRSGRAPERDLKKIIKTFDKQFHYSPKSPQKKK